MSKNSKDLLVSMVCLLFALGFLLLVIPAQIPLPKFVSGGTTPRAIPKICCWTIMAMSTLMLVRTAMRDRMCFAMLGKELMECIRLRRGFRSFGCVMLVFVLSLIYYIGYETVGFFIATLAIFPVYAFVLGCRKLGAIIITDLLLTFAVYYSFSIFMHCYLPGWAPF